MNKIDFIIEFNKILYFSIILAMVRSVDEVMMNGRMLKAKILAYMFSSKYTDIKNERIDLKSLVIFSKILFFFVEIKEKIKNLLKINCNNHF